MSLKKIKQLFNIEKGVLQSSKCIEGEYDFITAAADWKTHNEYTHDCEALIFAAAASGSLGRTHYVNGKFISSDLCFILTPKEPEKLPVNLRFYHIIFNLYKNEIVAATKAGTSKEAIGLRVFGEYELPYFDISIQQKVKAEFGKAEALKNDLFDEYTYQLTLLENLNQAILQEAVQGKLVPQDPNDEPASELLKRIKAEKATLRQAQGKGKKEKPLPPIKPEYLPAGKAGIPFEIPENWVWCRLGEIIEYTENLDIQKHLSPDTIINYVDIDAIDNQNFVIREAKQKTVSELSTRARRILKPNYIVYSTVRPYLKNIAIVEDEKDNYIGSTGFNVFKTLDVELKYAFYYLLTPYVNNSFKDLMVGFNSPSITNDQFEKSLFPLPPLSEQKRIVAEIEKQLAKTKQLKEMVIQNQQATEQLLKALLHQAFEVKEMEEVNS
jgi:type I restriction enzyme S subunit